VVIIGRSPIVGLPLAAMFNNLNATVTICHSHTQNLAQITYQADVIVSAVGRSHFVTKDMVNTNTIVIDVGTNFDASGHLTGDVDFDNVAPIASHITPVPGGVGPMTIASLLCGIPTISITQNKVILIKLVFKKDMSQKDFLNNLSSLVNDPNQGPILKRGALEVLVTETLVREPLLNAKELNRRLDSLRRASRNLNRQINN
jgi:hypothetical protein